MDLCRKGQGPVFIECMTYRLRGHVGPDDNIQGTHTDIRPPEEVSKWRKRDPIKKFESFLIKNSILEKEDLEKISQEAKKRSRRCPCICEKEPLSKRK